MVLASIAEQGKLTPDLEALINAAANMTALEDLYAPYRPKRRTRASIAREKGLEKLGEYILTQARTPQSAEETARSFLNDQVPTVEEALAGARDIAAEDIADHAEVRRITREKALQFATLHAEKIANSVDEKQVYSLYYKYENQVNRLRPHQVLALDRGETEKVLRVSLTVPERDWKYAVTMQFRPDLRSPFCAQLELAITDCAERLLLPAIERDVRRDLTEKAQAHAIRVFGENLRALLSQPPLAGHTVLGLDPGFRTGTKWAVVDVTSQLLDHGTIYPHEPQKQWKQSQETLAAQVEKHHITLLSIGNGTASRETEQLAAELCSQIPGLRYIITNEAGASVYSASPLARQEFPDLDVSIRGAVSIARRVQDPLAELVKIDPRSIGVGLYQHDVDQNKLKAALDGVVEDVVNRVGADLNTASPALLAYVAGIGPKLAQKIFEHRSAHGAFKERTELHQVASLGPKAFEQCAGFLRIRNGINPLDTTAIHPESYVATGSLLKLAKLTPSSSPADRKIALDALLGVTSPEILASELGCGLPTLQDILEQLVRPGRDPREDTPPPILRSDVLKMEDLVKGMVLSGTVRNVVDFGAFVDIGVKQDGLLHRSQIPPGTNLSVGDIIKVSILNVEIERGRVSLGAA